MIIEETKTIECNTVEAAELEYFWLQQQKCWQVLKALKVVWSWRKLKTVVRFTVRKVEPKYFVNYMGDLQNAISGFVAIAANISAIKKLRRERPTYQLPEGLKSLK